MGLAAVGGEDDERGHVAQAEVGFHAVHGALGDDAERAGVRVELGDYRRARGQHGIHLRDRRDVARTGARGPVAGAKHEKDEGEDATAFQLPRCSQANMPPTPKTRMPMIHAELLLMNSIEPLSRLTGRRAAIAALHPEAHADGRRAD